MKEAEDLASGLSSALTGSIFGQGLNILVLLYTYLWVLFGREFLPLQWLGWLLNNFFGANPQWLPVASEAMSHANAEVATSTLIIAAIIIIVHGTFINKGNQYVFTLVTVLLLCSVEISGDWESTYIKYLLITIVPVVIAVIRYLFNTKCDNKNLWNCFKGWFAEWLLGPALHIGLIIVGILVVFLKFIGHDYLSTDSE